MKDQTIQRVIEIDLDEVRSPKYRANEEREGCTSETCFICGKQIKNMDKAAWVHYTTNNTIVSYDGDDLDISQGFFPVGTDCKKKLHIAFTFKQ